MRIVTKRILIITAILVVGVPANPDIMKPAPNPILALTRIQVRDANADATGNSNSHGHTRNRNRKPPCEYSEYPL
jgi:hypothetical protein